MTIRARPSELTPVLLRRTRLRLNYSQSEMGVKLGVSAVTWGRWERGEVQPEHPPMLLCALEYLLAQHETKREPGAPENETMRHLAEMGQMAEYLDSRHRVARRGWDALAQDMAQDERRLV